MMASIKQSFMPVCVLMAVFLVVMPGCITRGPAEPPQTKPDKEKPDMGTPGAPEPVRDAWILLPEPRMVEFTGGWLVLKGQGGPGHACPPHAMAAEAADGAIGWVSSEALQSGVIQTTGTDIVFGVGLVPKMSFHRTGSCQTVGADIVCFKLDANRITHPEGYELSITRDGIEIVAGDEAGLWYGAMTLRQLARQAQRTDRLPCLRIQDWPEFPRRGIMLDVARDKVPEMESLYRFVDKMAEWKLNELQLYTEHTYAYRDHAVVWQDASPMTAAQIRALDAYCQARFIELVPNQNSFGHMGRWLQHEAYAQLAETPSGSDLSPVEPGSLALLRNMYGDMLPNFSSGFVNVGCDETWSLGKGRSAEAVKAKGVGRVYLDFILGIHEIVASHGKRMQFWGDIIMQHPELIPELPKDAVAMEWGYEANHPFAEHGKQFAAAGIEFYVVPGTSSWNSLLGRTDNALENLRNAAINGRANGAKGYLVTDWGDGGHWQFLPVSYGPFAYGAALSWSAEQNLGIDLARALDVHVFEDKAGVMGRMALDLGNAYQKTGILPGNNTVFYGLLLHHMSKPFGESWLKDLKAEALRDTIAYLDDRSAALSRTDMTCLDAALIRDEYAMGVAMARFACELGIARAEAGGVEPSKLPETERARLAATLRPMIPAFRQLWLMRNRSGGLKGSTGHMEALLAALEQR